MKLRKFHLTDFPQDRIFVFFDDSYRVTLFNLIKEKYGFVRLNRKYFNGRLNYSTYKQWQKGKTQLKLHLKKHFIPLWFILKLSEILTISIIELERQIIAYKGPSSSAIISNPNLPLVEDQRLLKILAHLIGDGCVDGAFGTGLPKGKSHSEYRNFDHSLLDQFEKDLFAFGNININKDYDHGHVIVPNSIGYILKHIYKINFDSLTQEFLNIFLSFLLKL